MYATGNAALDDGDLAVGLDFRLFFFHRLLDFRLIFHFVHFSPKEGPAQLRAGLNRYAALIVSKRIARPFSSSSTSAP